VKAETMRLYHVTTKKKAKLYSKIGSIKPPVRGFDTLLAAMAWAIKTGRKVIYVFETDDSKTWKLPDHHNKYGEAWWTENRVDYKDIKCEYGGGD